MDCFFVVVLLYLFIDCRLVVETVAYAGEEGAVSEDLKWQKSVSD